MNRWIVGAVGIGILALVFRSKKKMPDQPPPPSLTPPKPPGGWAILKNSEITPALQAKAVEILNSGAPMGSMVPFTQEGKQYGGFVTIHPGTTRAVEIWRPA